MFLTALLPLILPITHTSDGKDLGLQKKSMQCLLSLDPATYKQHGKKKRSRPPYPVQNYFRDECTWHGVTCVDGDVHEVDWVSRRVPMIFTYWLPSTVKVANFINQSIHCPFETRTLPKSLCTLKMSSCSLEGSIDLTSLPDSLESLEAQGNNLSGAVSLERLPPNMKQIDLSRNLLRRVYGRAFCLPESFRAGRFGPRTGRVKYTAIDDSEMDERINLKEEVTLGLVANPLAM